MIRTINRRPLLTNISMFVSSLWDNKEPSHYLRRVGDEDPGVVAVLFSPTEVASQLGSDVSKKECGVFMRPPKQKQP